MYMSYSYLFILNLNGFDTLSSKNVKKLGNGIIKCLRLISLQGPS